MGNATKSAGGSLRFAYGANQRRYKQIKTSNGETTTTIYVDKLFERTIRSQGTVDRFYVGDIAVIIKEAGNSKVRYLHRDRLGSMIGSFDEQGNLLQHHSYDPFGKPRDGRLRDNFTDVLTGITIPQNILGSETTNRGFTDHEHLDDAQLIHMNGRVYDYNLGRFLSVDPFIQAPGNSQSMNPYSYIMNNPLAGTDPSGYAAECKSDDYACQWDQSMASVLGVPREVITEMYNGIKRKKNAVKNHVAKVKNVSPDEINVELEYDEETDTEYAIVTISGGMKRTSGDSPTVQSASHNPLPIGENLIRPPTGMIDANQKTIRLGFGFDSSAAPNQATLTTIQDNIDLVNNLLASNGVGVTVVADYDLDNSNKQAPADYTLAYDATLKAWVNSDATRNFALIHSHTAIYRVLVTNATIQGGGAGGIQSGNNIIIRASQLAGQVNTLAHELGHVAGYRNSSNSIHEPATSTHVMGTRAGPANPTVDSNYLNAVKRLGR